MMPSQFAICEFPIASIGLVPLVPGITLRPCQSSDHRFLLRLYSQTREDELTAANWPDALRETFCAQQFAAQHNDWINRFPTAHFLLMLHKGHPVGRLYLSLTSDEIRLIDIAILAAHRKQGRGTAALHALQRMATEGRVPLRLSVLRENVGARTLYERMGFALEHETPDRLHLIWQPIGQAG